MEITSPVVFHSYRTSLSCNVTVLSLFVRVIPAIINMESLWSVWTWDQAREVANL